MESLAEKLFVFDVVQGAWEHEAKGPGANARHVLTHMTKSLITKDFLNPEVVRDEIAPDSLQYALRFGRWINLGVVEITKLTNKEERARSGAEMNIGYDTPWGFPSFVGATGLLAGHLHDLDHKSTRAASRLKTPEMLRSVARLLFNSASIQAFQFGFELDDAFDARLATLRTRFEIPNPQ